MRESVFVSNVRLRLRPIARRCRAFLASRPQVVIEFVVLPCSNSWNRARVHLRRRTPLERLNRQWGCR